MMSFRRIRNLESSVSHLPEEIIREILLRLPIKCLCKVRAVCKSWNSLITSSDFIHHHLSQRIQSHNQKRILLGKSTVGVKVEGSCFIKSVDKFSFHWDNPPFDEYTKYKQLTNPFLAYNRHAMSPKYRVDLKYGVRVVGICKGLVCLRTLDNTALLWNPCVRRYVHLPRPAWCSDCRYAFGYDSINNDYKVLRWFIFEGKTCWEIWSLSQPSWKSLSVVLPTDNFRSLEHTVFVHGAVHWLNWARDKPYSIVSFDMSSESFAEKMMILPVPEASHKEVHILQYGSWLAFFDIARYRPQVDMWVMKEYGAVESWTKLLTLQRSGRVVQMVGFRNSGEPVFYSRGWKYLNPETNYIGDFSTDRWTFVQPFVESLVLLDQPNAISC